MNVYINKIFKSSLLLVILTINISFGNFNLKDDLQDARYTFHRAYFEEADRLFKDLAEEVQDDPLIYAYKSMIDYMLFRNSEENTESAKQYLNEENPDYYFIKALLKFVENDFDSAAIFLELHISKFEDDSFAKHALGFTRYDNGQPEEGLKILLNLIETDPTYFPAYNHIGYAYMALNNLDSAISYFKEFVVSDSLNPSAYDSYAEGLAEQKKYDSAISQLTKATLIDSRFAYGWKHMGDIFDKLNKPWLSIKAYEKAKENSELYGKSFVISVDKKIKLLKITPSIDNQ